MVNCIMFFIGIFGIQNKQKELRQIQNIICKACGTMSSYTLIKAYSCFEFFFIPLFRWGETYYLKDRHCGAVFEISKELGKRLESGEDVSINDWDLRQINSDYNYGYGNSGYVICRKCGREVDSSYEYCPYCGEKLR